MNNAATSSPSNTVSSVLGVLSLVFWMFPGVNFAIPLAGIVLAVRKRYTAGLVLNTVGLCLSIVCLALNIFIVPAAGY